MDASEFAKSSQLQHLEGNVKVYILSILNRDFEKMQQNVL